MPRSQILATINLAHHFRSAFSVDQVYHYLKIPLARHEFDAQLASLIDAKTVYRVDDILFTEDLVESYRQKRDWSRQIFRHHRRYLRMVVRTPWVRFVALTGANAFESCAHRDDLDLFLITKRNRLWLTYLTLVIFSKLSRKRDTLCINYLIDENNLYIDQQDYYTAVQIMQMIPVLDSPLGQALVAKNPWVFQHLPNARREIGGNQFYRLQDRRQSSPEHQGSWKTVTRLNQLVFRQYAQRLQRKYPAVMGKGIVLAEGLAKLNRVDHHDMYEKIYAEIHERLKEESLT